jgi:hypothetical protein
VLQERRASWDEPCRLVDERPHKEVAEGGQHDRDEHDADLDRVAARGATRRSKKLTSGSAAIARTIARMSWMTIVRRR